MWFDSIRRYQFNSLAIVRGFFVSGEIMDPTAMEGVSSGWLAAAGGGIIWGLTALRKQFSGASAAVANDRAEKDMLERLMEDNKELRASLESVTGERNEMYRAMGEMTGMIKAMEAKLSSQEAHIAELTKEVAALRESLSRRHREDRQD